MGEILMIGKIASLLVCLAVAYLLFKWLLNRRKKGLTKNNKWIVIVILIMIFGGIGAVLSDDSSTKSADSNNSSASKKQSNSIPKKINKTNIKSDSKSKNTDQNIQRSSHSVGYEEKLNSLNKGTAEYAKYDKSTNTVTWTGFDDWANWSDNELQKSMDILQTITYRYESKYNILNVKIIVQLADGTQIAKTTDNNMDLQFVR